MPPHPAACLVIFLAVLGAGCSTFIASGGVNLDRALGPEGNRASVAEALGPPVASVTFPRPRRVGDIAEVKAMDTWDQPDDLDALAAGHSDYRYRGMIYNHGANQAAGMVFGLSLGLAEFWAFPESLRYAAEERKADNRIRVWYAPDGHSVGYRHEVAQAAGPEAGGARR